ncbi:MAG: anthranilate phosphoribosyltransferase [Deltaproteobacteria bacterium RIFCSPLOWO2_12_FULL_50_11]|nr:MAG: anthranilate phosphoribosyltransferase [Deltaproteobacteria bacterium GWA2_50_8]OGQ26649.1 MAG: anthranilate phosphoribosyltransferase [Deltaproteobacteria bacterium RIFCSPHIGHO2_02_FULL_50_15]OGQ68773.1 MAG: anthranilate phosphoribosyltransferase [Deltaproteobacteria bacterium RIFCSPLOWO2_12_FULL_50_11]
MLKTVLQRLTDRKDLSQQEMESALRSMMTGQVSEGDIISFLTLLKDKGETVSEITGATLIMREVSEPVSVDDSFLVDTCGTGGDQKGTFNISTAAAFVAAGAGAKVAKHGNRSISSQSGSADVLEKLGVKIDCETHVVKKCLEEIGIGFFFAPRYHPAMRYVATARKKIGSKTIFNILGPLTNPAGAKRQLIGVYDPSVQEKMATVLMDLGSEHVWVVHGSDGLDEITLTGPTHVVECHEGRLKKWELMPQDYNLKACRLEDLLGGDAVFNANLLKGILEGFVSPLRDVVVLNAAAALTLSGKAHNLEEGLMMACHSIDKGHAFNTLKRLVEITQGTQ